MGAMLIFLSYQASAEVLKEDFAVGINYPGLGVRYFLSDKISLEGKVQIGKGIFVTGLRGYYYFSPKVKYLLFAGLEGDFITFEGDDSKGRGFAGALFVGGEYFFYQMPFVPAGLRPCTHFA